MSGNATIRAPFKGSNIVITTTDRLAGAIHSLRWNGREFIDSHDHGRQLQSAASFDAAHVGGRSGGGAGFWAEQFNPTEAGSRADGAGPTSTSQLLEIESAGATLRTKTRMSFWLAPGEKSSGRPALNTTKLSRHVVSKRVRIGYRDLPNVIQYDVTFTVPAGERHTYAQFEALTGYMPPAFEKFYTFDPKAGQLRPLTDGPGEQRHPVVFATADGEHAMGVYSPDQPSPGYAHAGYGRFRFKAEQVVKWNCVFRVRDEDKVAAGDYRYRVFVAVGTVDDVRKAMIALHVRLNL